MSMQRAIEVNKGRLSKWFSKPEFICQVTLRNIFMATRNTFFKIFIYQLLFRIILFKWLASRDMISIVSPMF